MPLIFVYGTLKRGDVRSGALAGERFLGEVRTRPLYRLYDCGDYPGLMSAPAGSLGTAIAGELYEVSPACLERLDEVEGVAERLYERRQIELDAAPFAEPVEAYFYLLPVAGLADCGPRWERRSSGSGDVGH